MTPAPSPDPTRLVAAARDGVAAPDPAAEAPTRWEGRARVRIWQRGWIIGEGEAASAEQQNSEAVSAEQQNSEAVRAEQQNSEAVSAEQQNSEAVRAEQEKEAENTAKRHARSKSNDPDPLAAVRTAAARAAADRQERPDPTSDESPAPTPDDASQFHNDFEDQTTAPANAAPTDPPAFLEIEIVDDLQTIHPTGLSGLIQSIHPPRDGLVLSDNGRTAGGWPTDPLQAAEPTPYWIKGLLKQARPPGYWLPESVDVQRFTTRRFVAMQDAAPATDDDTRPDSIVEFDGDTRRVPIEHVTQDRLVTAAVQAGAWLGRHQLPNGLFRYEFVPQLDEWSRADSVVRQAGCAWSMARLARVSRQKPFVASAARAIAGLMQTGLKRDGAGGLATLADAGGHRRLGAIPFAILALAEIEGPSSGQDSPTEDLTATLLALQDRSGAFGTSVRGTELEGSEIYYAGQCTLALARRYLTTKRDRLAEAVRAAVAYYRSWWDDPTTDNKDLSFLTWMIQACDLADSIPATAGAADFAYDMADWALERQYPASHPTLGWAGGFEGGPGIGTAAYTEGIAAAWAIALRRGDADRAARYRDSVLQAERFLLQLQLEPADLVFLRSAGHRGAVRRSLRSRALRCDNAQHFLMAALRTASLLNEEKRGAASAEQQDNGAARAEQPDSEAARAEQPDSEAARAEQPDSEAARAEQPDSGNA